MHGIGDVQPDMPVDSAAFVPPAFAAGGDMDGEYVRPAIVDGVRDVDVKRVVSVILEVQGLAIYIHGGVTEDSFEVQPEALAPIGRLNVEMFAVPGRHHRQRPVAD